MNLETGAIGGGIVGHGIVRQYGVLLVPQLIVVLRDCLAFQLRQNGTDGRVYRVSPPNLSWGTTCPCLYNLQCYPSGPHMCTPGEGPGVVSVLNIVTVSRPLSVCLSVPATQ